ncbi:lantibiotic dehydratase [Streptomyces angustmyceticus]|uniref:lantibiotic dehydratase n=1 Tax=Streptomyces angustmyceticus TaxID=285578 RepID=UPI0038153D7E
MDVAAGDGSRPNTSSRIRHRLLRPLRLPSWPRPWSSRPATAVAPDRQDRLRAGQQGRGLRMRTVRRGGPESPRARRRCSRCPSEGVPAPRQTSGNTPLPTVEPGAELAQLPFHAGRVPADLLTRAPRVLPRVVSVGEFRHPGDGALFPSDLAVSVRDGRPCLVEIATGTHLELLAPTAINFLWNNYTPPMARFLGEISRATAPQVTWFDWGAAWTLPFTPALTYRRSILAVARWKVRTRDLPGRTAPIEEWAEQLHAWRGRFRVPERVLLAEDDQQLPLDLSQDMHLDLLRAHLDASPIGVATLHEAPPPDGDGWIGGRAHSLVLPLAARS